MLIDQLNGRAVWAFVQAGIHGTYLTPIARIHRIGGCAWGFYMYELPCGKLVDAAYCTLTHYDY